MRGGSWGGFFWGVRKPRDDHIDQKASMLIRIDDLSQDEIECCARKSAQERRWGKQTQNANESITKGYNSLGNEV